MPAWSRARQIWCPMNNEIYVGLVVSARDAADGETPTRIILTKEANGHAIWKQSAEEGIVLVEHAYFSARDAAIKKAVDLENELRLSLSIDRSCPSCAKRVGVGPDRIIPAHRAPYSTSACELSQTVIEDVR